MDKKPGWSNLFSSLKSVLGATTSSRATDSTWQADSLNGLGATSMSGVDDAGILGSSKRLGDGAMRILKKGQAMRVIFFYPGEEGTYIDNAHVSLFENGIVHIKSNHEETTTHLQNCEILWQFEVEGEDRANKVRLLKPKAGASHDKDPSKGGPDKSPELR